MDVKQTQEWRTLMPVMAAAAATPGVTFAATKDEQQAEVRKAAGSALAAPGAWLY